MRAIRIPLHDGGDDRISAEVSFYKGGIDSSNETPLQNTVL